MLDFHRLSLIINRLYRLRSGGGLAPARLAAAEARLNWRLPQLLRRYLLCFGGHEALNQAHQRLLAPEDWAWAGDYLPLFEENQGVCCWGLHRRAAGPNPPCHWAAATATGWQWQSHWPDTGRLLLEMACSNASLDGLAYCGSRLVAPEPAAVAWLQRRWTEIRDLRSPNQRFYHRRWREIMVLCLDEAGHPSGLFYGGNGMRRCAQLGERFAWDYLGPTVD